MISKERVLRNYTFQSIDRFTIDFCAESAVYAKLRAHFGVSDGLARMEKLHAGFRYPKPEWGGFPLVDEQGRRTDYFGIPRGAGDFGYALEDPLAGVRTIAEVEAYPKWPSPICGITRSTGKTVGGLKNTPCSAACGAGCSRPPATLRAWKDFSS